jgi:hypothetical protein
VTYSNAEYLGKRTGLMTSSVDKRNFWLDYSSYYAQPHSIIIINLRGVSTNQNIIQIMNVFEL